MSTASDRIELRTAIERYVKGSTADSDVNWAWRVDDIMQTLDDWRERKGRHLTDPVDWGRKMSTKATGRAAPLRPEQALRLILGDGVLLGG